MDPDPQHWETVEDQDSKTEKEVLSILSEYIYTHNRGGNCAVILVNLCETGKNILVLCANGVYSIYTSCVNKQVCVYLGILKKLVRLEK
jgi:hypothetical protein